MTWLEFLHSKVGHNWVVARRTARIVRTYGDDVAAISQARYRQLRAEYDALSA